MICKDCGDLYLGFASHIADLLCSLFPTASSNDLIILILVQG